MVEDEDGQLRWKTEDHRLRGQILLCSQVFSIQYLQILFSKYHFSHREVEELHGTAPWFFGEMTRKEAENLLSDTANPDGSFLVRGSSGRDVISIKYFDFGESNDFRYAHYDVKTGDGQLWLGGSGGSQRKFHLLTDLVAFCMGGKLEGLKTMLTNICLIPNPHSDPYFEFYSQDHDSLRVPFSEITLGKKLGSGQFGDVYKGTFRVNLDVAIKCLKLLGTDEGQKVLEDFQNEIETQKGLHHPNLIQLFGFVTHKERGNFMIQEYMGKGDLKSFLVALRQDQAKLEREKSLLWGKLITWCLEVNLDQPAAIPDCDCSGGPGYGETRGAWDRSPRPGCQVTSQVSLLTCKLGTWLPGDKMGRSI